MTSVDNVVLKDKHLFPLEVFLGVQKILVNIRV